MATDVYDRLGAFLDDLPPGFPTTDSGVEQRILRRFFTPEEAELALHLTLLPEPARVVARRARIPVEEATKRLQEMEGKGLIYAMHEGKEPEYMATASGIYEFQLNRLDAGFARDLEEFVPAWFDQAAWDRAPRLRTIPVGASISTQTEVLAYERAGELIRTQDRLVVAQCICRKKRRIAGRGCDKPLETCLVMGSVAAYYLRNGLGRATDQTEALEILSQAEEKGLVLQPANARDASNICMCCGCCCRILTNAKRQPRPASFVANAFVAALNVEACEGCGTCETRCQMEAVYLDDGHAVLDPDRCVGCGLCVTTCPSDCLSLQRKPEAAQPYVPKNLIESDLRLGRARGKLTVGELLGMLVRSRMDRLLSPR